MYKKALFSLGNQRSGRPFVVDTEVNNSFVTSMTIINMHETFHIVQTVYYGSVLIYFTKMPHQGPNKKLGT